MWKKFIWPGIVLGVLFVLVIFLLRTPELEDISITDAELLNSIESPNGS
jgi:hypothetical protein